MKQRKEKGAEGFEHHYRQLFSTDTAFQNWKEAMFQRNLPILRFHPQNRLTLKERWDEEGFSWKPLDWYPNAVEWPKEAPFGSGLPGYPEGLLYPMNASSLIPVLALEPRPGEMILDACAAPGGKTLMISEQLGDSGHLIANDLSHARSLRLKDTLKSYQATNTEVWNKKAETLFRQHPETFDRILVDAPCSSEKHVLQNPIHLKRWSPARIKQLHHRQIALLSGLFLALKPGGRMVYATCATTPKENEEVVAKILKKKKGGLRILPWTWETPGEPGMPGNYTTDFPLDHVRHIWPHKTPGLDPMFVAVFEKNAS